MMQAFTDAMIDELRGKFTTHKPFPHLLIKNFLSETDAKTLVEALKNEQFEEKESDLFSFKQTQDLHYSGNKVIKEFVAMLESKEFAEFIKKISDIKVKRGALDLSGSLYEDTNYLLCHDDQLEDRKIAYILYLSDLGKNDGGALVLREDSKGKPSTVVKRYYPDFNSLILFQVSKQSWHEVEEVLGKKKRYAIGGWLR